MQLGVSQHRLAGGAGLHGGATNIPLHGASSELACVSMVVYVTWHCSVAPVHSTLPSCSCTESLLPVPPSCLMPLVVLLVLPHPDPAAATHCVPLAAPTAAALTTRRLSTSSLSSSTTSACRMTSAAADPQQPARCGTSQSAQGMQQVGAAHMSCAWVCVFLFWGKGQFVLGARGTGPFALSGQSLSSSGTAASSPTGEPIAAAAGRCL